MSDEAIDTKQSDTPDDLLRKLAEVRRQRDAEFEARLEGLLHEYGKVPVVQQVVAFADAPPNR